MLTLEEKSNHNHRIKQEDEKEIYKARLLVNGSSKHSLGDIC
jgi:hypothetical protein